MKVGCCGWSYLDAKAYFGDRWKERFESKLAAYASLFELVEINSTFYRIPKEKTAERWRNEVPKEFEFTVKCSQIVSHKDRFRTNVSLEAFNQTKRIAEILNARIILIQCPPSWHINDENERLFRRFMESIDWNGKIAWEYRGKENKERVKELCKEFSLIHCVDPLRERSLSKGIGYYRLHGFGKPSMYNYRFSDEELERIRRNVRKKSYVLFNNIYCYEDALRFMRMIQ